MIDITVRLTKEQRQRIAEGEAVTISILPPQKSRAQHVTSELDLHRVPQKIQELILAWNESDYIRHSTGESRNNPITDQQITDNLSVFKRAIAELGEKAIVKAMDKYFEACRKERHLWDGKNHGYSHLGGFVRKLLDCKGTDKKPWWATKTSKLPDDHPELTKKVADAYAKKFTRRKEWGLKNPSYEYSTFCEAADWIEVKKDEFKKTFHISESRLIEILLNCVEQSCKEKNRMPSPTWLSSEWTWKNDLPIYIKNMFG